MKNLLRNLMVVGLYALLAYPMLYYTYKYFLPDIAIIDYFDYYPMYRDFNLSEVESPFNTRLVSPFLVHLFYKLGIFYETEIAFNDPSLDKRVFFSALFVSYISVVLTAFFIYKSVQLVSANKLLPFLAGLVYFSGFFTLTLESSPITDGFSVFMFALGFYLTMKRSYWIFLLFAFLIVQREFVFILFGIIAFVELVRNRRIDKYWTSVLVGAITCFVAYFILRKTMFYTPKYDHQINAANYLDSLIHTSFDLWPYIKQSLLTQNILFIYLLLLVYKVMARHKVDWYNCVTGILCLLMSISISYMVVLGNSAGRYFYIFIPAILTYSAMEIAKYVGDDK